LLLITMAAFAIYFAITAKKVLVKVGYSLLAALYLVYSFTTGTRSVIVGTVCAVLLTGYFIMKKFCSRVFARKALRIGAQCLAVTVAMAALFAVITTVLNVSDESRRPDVDAENISNNRFTIWGEYLDIVFDNPLSTVFGFSLGEYQQHITNEYSDKYIVQHIKECYPSMFARGYIYDTHSAYVGALVMTGVAGVAVLFVFLILGLVKLMKALSKKQDVGLLVLFATLVFILITSFFDSDLFFRCTSTSVLFWLISGFALKLTEE